MAHPPPHVQAHEPRQPARARLQGGGHDHDAVRHGHAQRPRPLSSRDGRDRPRARPREQLRATPPGDGGPTGPLARLDSGARRGRSRGAGLDLAVLVVNAGSTSLKLHLVDGEESTAVETLDVECKAVAHRVVHGGPTFREPVVIDAEVERRIHELEAIAPLHNAPALRAIREARRAHPSVPHVAVFDTAFHATIQDEAATYAVPARWREEWGVRRYGFHGLSVQWAAE